MQKIIKLPIVIVLLLMLSMTSCATIFQGGKSIINITSEPSNAKLTIIEINTQQEVYSGTTPAVVELKRGRGYFKKADYKITFELPGRKNVVMRLIPDKLNTWGYIVGNVFSGLGLLIGMPIVDPLTGAVFDWAEPKKISGNAVFISSIKRRKNNALFVRYLEEGEDAGEVSLSIKELQIEGIPSPVNKPEPEQQTTEETVETTDASNTETATDTEQQQAPDETVETTDTSNTETATDTEQQAPDETVETTDASNTDTATDTEQQAPDETVETTDTSNTETEAATESEETTEQ